MLVGVRLGYRAVVMVPVVLVMDVRVIVFDLVVDMLMVVVLGQVEPDAKPHQNRRRGQPDRYRLPEDRQGGDASDEGSRREIGPGAGGANVPQGDHEQHEADAVAQQPDQHRRRCGWHGRQAISKG